MKKIFAMLMALASITASAQVTSTPTGAKITLDSITTEIVIYSPEAVRVIKYKGERPEIKPLKIKGVPAIAEAKEYKKAEGHNKFKVDTGKYYAAINDKDGNISFWDYDDNLILAEQHKTGIITSDEVTGKPKVSQDFQMGLAKADTIFCSELKEGKRTNLKGTIAKVGDKKAGLPTPNIRTERMFEIKWQTKKPTVFDFLPREGKKNGDITVTSEQGVIDYVFLRNQ